MSLSFPEHQLTLCALLTSYSYGSGNLGRTDLLIHRIDTRGNPIRQAVRRVPLPKREEVKKLLVEIQENITPSKSPWESPIVLVPRKDGSLCFCVDYRKVNEITHKDAYPIPRIDDTCWFKMFFHPRWILVSGGRPRTQRKNSILHTRRPVSI